MNTGGYSCRLAYIRISSKNAGLCTTPYSSYARRKGTVTTGSFTSHSERALGT